MMPDHCLALDSLELMLLHLAAAVTQRLVGGTDRRGLLRCEEIGSIKQGVLGDPHPEIECKNTSDVVESTKSESESLQKDSSPSP